MKRQFITYTALLLLAGATAGHATQTVRELWDNFIPGDTRIDLVKGSATAVGFESNSNWVNNLNSPVLTVDNNNAVYGAPGLPERFTAAGDIWCNAYATYPVNGLIDNHDPRSWAVRQLIPSAQINFNAAGTYYFSIQLWHGNDASLGMGFASGTNDSARYVGAGISRASHLSGRFTNIDTSTIELGNTLYITTGTLGQAGDPLDPDYGVYPAEGPNMIMAYATNSIGLLNPANGYATVAGLLAGKITTSAGGSSTLSVSWFTNAAIIPVDPGTVVWDSTYSFTETINMTHLLLWMTGNDYQSAIDGIRVATTWPEVVGIESKISISPTNVVPTGQAVTFSSQAFNAPVSYQWTKDGSDILNATNSTYPIASPVVGDSGIYTLVVSNSYGMSTNNPVIQLTVTPPVPPSITTQPVSGTRYLGAPQTFTVVGFGSAPFSYQWTHAGTNLPAGTNASLVINSVTAADAGIYNVTISSPYPPAATSSNVTLTIATPPANSYVEAVVTNGASSLWQFNELTNDLVSLTPSGMTLHDYISGRDGVGIDTNNQTYGVSGPPYVGFPAGSTALQTGWGPAGNRVNLPITVWSNQMTLCGWVRGNGLQHGIMFNTDNDYSANNNYGLRFSDWSAGNNTLFMQWGGTNSIGNSLIVLSNDVWSFVALVVEPTQATIYAGVDPVTLQSQTFTGMTNNTVTRLQPMTVGRTDYTWSGPGNAWANDGGQYCDLAVFYKSLSAATITNLFLAGYGVNIKGTPDGGGNLVVNWLPGGTLQAAPAVTGTYTNVPGAIPPYTVPMSESQLFFRVYR